MNANPPARQLLVGLAVGFLVAGCSSVATTSAPPTAVASGTASVTVGTPTPTLSATSPTGEMTHGRSTQTATPLADGRILVAGGYFAAAPIASADLYDPRTDAFTATGSMATARGFDTATRLVDDRVLFAGGNPKTWDFAGPFFASAELYDPKTRTFSMTGSLATARNLHTATLLPDGRVLITGGNDTFGHGLASAELYDPKTGRFSATGSMATARGFHTATPGVCARPVFALGCGLAGAFVW
jgi:hypothetical protein